MPFVVFMAIAVASNVGAQLFIKKGILTLGEITFSFSQATEFIFRIVQNVWIMAGLVLFGFSFLMWIVILSKMQLNIAYPTITALNFCFIILTSALIFREHLTIFQILGIGIILLGVFLVYSK